MKPAKRLLSPLLLWVPGRAPALLTAGLVLFIASIACSIIIERHGVRCAAAMAVESKGLEAVDHLGRLTLEAEAAFRGFVLTRDASFLSRYFTARNRILPGMQQLEALVNHRTESGHSVPVRRNIEAILEYHDVVSNAIFLHDSPVEADGLMRENKQRLDRFEQSLTELRAASLEHQRFIADRHAKAQTLWRISQGTAILLSLLSGSFGLLLLVRSGADQRLCTLKLQGAARACAADIRERKTMARLNAILEAAGDTVIITTTPEGIIDGFHGGASRVLGYTAKEMLGKDLGRIMSNRSRRFSDMVQDREWTCLRKDGTSAMLSVQIEPIRDGQDTISGYTVVAIDVTHQRHCQLLHDAFTEHAPVVWSVKDRSGRIVYLNQACRTMWRVSPQDAGKLDFEILPLDMAQKIRANDAAVLDLKQPLSVQEEYECPDGERRTFMSHRFPIRLPGYEGILIGNASVDVTASKLLEQQLLNLKDELVTQTERAWKTTRVKDTFLACMSHEIRTPVNAMTGMAELLWETSLDDEQRTFVRIFRTNADQLLCIVNDILDLAKVESGEMKIACERLDLETVVNETVELMGMGARVKGLSLTSSLPSGVPLGLMGDAGRIRQILVNLVGNAIKFTERGGIHISVRQECDTADFFRFEVADTGQGIPRGSEESIFKPFVQCDPSLMRRNAGAGLGLSICQRLTDLMGGTIGVESRPGSGSVFWFSIPLRRDPSLAALEPIAETRTVTHLSAGEPMRILLVDDLHDNAFLVRCLLRGEPVSLDIVYDGCSAMSQFKQQSYDLILMDVVMPGVDGHTATRQIREWERNQNRQRTPIIALTAQALSDEREKSLQAGCDDHIVKPIRRHDLIQVISRYARTREPRPTAQIMSQLKDIVPDFLDRRRGDIDTLRRALAEADYKQLHMIGHNLKGSGGGYGFQPITDIGVEIEDAVSRKDEAAISRSIEALERYLNSVAIEFV